MTDVPESLDIPLSAEDRASLDRPLHHRDQLSSMLGMGLLQLFEQVLYTRQEIMKSHQGQNAIGDEILKRMGFDPGDANYRYDHQRGVIVRTAKKGA